MGLLCTQECFLETLASIHVSKFKGALRCPEKGPKKSVVQSEGLALTLCCLSKCVVFFFLKLWSIGIHFGVVGEELGWGENVGQLCSSSLVQRREHTLLWVARAALALPLPRDMTSKWLRHLSLSFLI